MLPNRLYYMSKGKWEALPSWGQLFFDLGYALAVLDDSENRVVAGLALPTRAYAASLAALGVVVGRLSLLANGSEALKRFQQLATLAIGTSLFYRRNPPGERVKVFFDGLSEDKSYICLRAGTYVYKIPPSLALQVEFPAREFASLPSRQSHGLTGTTVSPFLSHFLGLAIAKSVALQSRLDCMMIGSLGRLEKEVNETQFAVRDSNGKFISGTLQDIMRVRRFSSNEAYRSDIYHMHSKGGVGIHQEMPLVTIFDGATSFLKSRNTWRHPHCIVLFDQTEPEFDAAVQAFNEDFIKNHLDDVDLKRQIKVPAKVPISVYQEVRK